MGQRLQLQSLLETLLGSGNVYFQPPNSVEMAYPAIVYNRDYGVSQFADNKPYRSTKRYQVTIIDEDPDSLIPDKVEALPLSRFSRRFAAESLNHTVFDLYF